MTSTDSRYQDGGHQTGTTLYLRKGILYRRNTNGHSTIFDHSPFITVPSKVVRCRPTIENQSILCYISCLEPPYYSMAIRMGTAVRRHFPWHWHFGKRMHSRWNFNSNLHISPFITISGFVTTICAILWYLRWHPAHSTSTSFSYVEKYDPSRFYCYLALKHIYQHIRFIGRPLAFHTFC